MIHTAKTENKLIVEARGLKKYFAAGKKKLHAVDDVSIAIQAGKTLGVVGESGCGKSTLGRVIMKLIEPTAGKIFFEGNDISKLSAKQMRKFRLDMQIIFQDPYSSLNPRQTISDSIAMPLKVHKLCSNSRELEKRTKELMDTVGIAQRLINAYPHELDGGRRQRVCVARALACNPKFIVCDEPVSALDVSIQAQILNLLMDIQEEMGLTYLFITHDMSVVKHISDDIMVMYMGKCVEMASYKAVFENPMHPYTKALLSAVPIPDISMRNKRAKVLRGEVTSPIEPEPGCRFAARCEYSSKACTGAEISLNEIMPNHFVACPFAKEAFKKD